MKPVVPLQQPRQSLRVLHELVDRYPKLDPVLVSKGYRDFVNTNEVRGPTELLEAFFERAENARTSERTNPHSPEGEKAKEKPYRIGWYLNCYETSPEEVERMISEGMAHSEIVAELEAAEHNDAIGPPGSVDHGGSRSPMGGHDE